MSFSPEQFHQLQDFILRESGIVIEPGKEYLVESRLGPVAREHGVESIGALIDRARSGRHPQVGRAVVGAMTTNETSFFRDIHPFEALRTDILPAMIKARASRRSLRIWCAACATGQEPYSIAMLLLEHFPALVSWDVEILATDLAEEVLARAAAGSFSQLEVNRGLPAPMLVKYFSKEGLRWVVQPQVRRLIEFRSLNLSARWPAVAKFDIVFVRNVLIYFSVETKRSILTGVHDLLAPDGVLFLGTAETTLGICEDFDKATVGKAICYRPRVRTGITR